LCYTINVEKKEKVAFGQNKIRANLFNRFFGRFQETVDHRQVGQMAGGIPPRPPPSARHSPFFVFIRRSCDGGGKFRSNFFV